MPKTWNDMGEAEKLEWLHDELQRFIDHYNGAIARTT